jgi:hypothetical protein
MQVAQWLCISANKQSSCSTNFQVVIPAAAVFVLASSKNLLIARRPHKWVTRKESGKRYRTAEECFF